LDLRKNTGTEEMRARDLFLGLWNPDLFMKRVESKGKWSLFCPAECPGLTDVWGDEFEALYTKYEREGKARTTMDARKLMKAITDSQLETGTPYMLNKDECNRKSNQQNVGTIISSNLCTEIIEYSSPDETAVCNLASLALPAMVSKNGKTFDFAKLQKVTKVMTKNLNKIININYYPIKTAETSNMRHRPIGIGVQGLADVFFKMKFPYESSKARDLNKRIFENMYYAALEASCELAQKEGPYASYEGSPVSKGILQFDMWKGFDHKTELTLDWASLKAKIAKHGVRNSLLLAPMPTATTSLILGNTESFEPQTSNLFQRRTLAGDFMVVNRYLVKELQALGLWNDDMRQKLIANSGSVKNVEGIPDSIKQVYKTVWEIDAKTLICMAADRGAFIDQSQSFNAHIENPTSSKIASMHMFAWKKGLKTGMYYLRSNAAADPIKFTISPEMVAAAAASESASSDAGDTTADIEEEAEEEEYAEAEAMQEGDEEDEEVAAAKKRARSTINALVLAEAAKESAENDLVELVNRKAGARILAMAGKTKKEPEEPEEPDFCVRRKGAGKECFSCGS